MKIKFFLGLTFIFLIFIEINAQKIELTGVWECNDEGKYYIRQIGTDVWWYGEQSETSPEWSNVASGYIKEDVIYLKWSDVPKGAINNNGTLRIKIICSTKLELIEEIGGFGGSMWWRPKE